MFGHLTDRGIVIDYKQYTSKHVSTPVQQILLQDLLPNSAANTTQWELVKSLNIVIKHVFICTNPYIYTTVLKEVYNRDRS